MNKLSSETIKILINKKLNNTSKYNRRNVLLDCINKNFTIPDVLLDSSYKTEKTDLQCPICQETEFKRYKHEEVCNNCDFVRLFQQQLKTFEKKVELIEPGQNFIKINKDGKEINVDLNKINNWLQDSDPLASDYNKIEETLNQIFVSKGRDMPVNVLNTCLALYINFNKLKNKMSKQDTFNKNAIIALCIYYGLIINSEEIIIEEISILLKIDLPIIYINNGILKIIFKNTAYFKYFTLTNQKICDIKLSLYDSSLVKNIKDNLVEAGYKDFENLDNKKKLAIIYFIKKNINNENFTLNKLVEECKTQGINISQQIISNEKKFIENFYSQNPNLLKKFKVNKLKNIF